MNSQRLEMIQERTEGRWRAVLVPHLAKDARLGALVMEALPAGRRGVAALLLHQRGEEASRVLEQVVVRLALPGHNIWTTYSAVCSGGRWRAASLRSGGAA